MYYLEVYSATENIYLIDIANISNIRFIYSLVNGNYCYIQFNNNNNEIRINMGNNIIEKNKGPQFIKLFIETKNKLINTPDTNKISIIKFNF